MVGKPDLTKNGATSPSARSRKTWALNIPVRAGSVLTFFPPRLQEKHVPRSSKQAENRAKRAFCNRALCDVAPHEVEECAQGERHQEYAAATSRFHAMLSTLAKLISTARTVALLVCVGKPEVSARRWTMREQRGGARADYAPLGTSKGSIGRFGFASTP